MTYCKEFFELQLRFAQRVAGLSGMPVEKALLDYTNLYIRFGLGRDFDPRHPIWRQYLEGLGRAPDDSAWTYRFFLQRPPDVEPPALVARFGCFSYAKPRDDCIRIHFQNVEEKKYSPLGQDRSASRFAELRALFGHIERTETPTLRVIGVSWLYNLPAYQRLFPPTYVASAKIAAPRFRNMPLWGQFLDRHGSIRQSAAAAFLSRLARTTGFDELARCFPLQALTVEAPVSDFYGFYGLEGKRSRPSA